MIIAGSGATNLFEGKRKDFIVLRGDTFEFSEVYEYYDSDGILHEYDFTGCIGRMEVKKRKTDSQPVVVMAVQFSGSTYTVSKPAEYMKIPSGRYYYDLQIFDADGKYVTKLYGTFTVVQDISDFTGIVDEKIITEILTELHKMVGTKETFEALFQSIIEIHQPQTLLTQTEIVTEILHEYALRALHYAGANIESEIIHQDGHKEVAQAFMQSVADYLRSIVITKENYIESEIIIISSESA